METRDYTNLKGSSRVYSEESKKIFAIINQHCALVEKAGCDEGFMNVTPEVDKMFKELQRESSFSAEEWGSDTYFMGFRGLKDNSEIPSGRFSPSEECDIKLLLACKIAKETRDHILRELGYKASAGISHNKTVAKLGSGFNKPNAQTVTPIRYLKSALENVEVAKIRFCGGKVSESLLRYGIHTMGELQGRDAE